MSDSRCPAGEKLQLQRADLLERVGMIQQLEPAVDPFGCTVKGISSHVRPIEESAWRSGSAPNWSPTIV
jgi:hypothetical protein